MKSTFLFLLLALTLPSTGLADVARDILDATGVTGGLVVHVGCGEGRLTAALHFNDSYLVHGLERKAKSVETARRFVLEQGLSGKVTIEHWSGSSLPYVDNLVNLLVIEDPADLSNEEVTRVLAPNGVAHVRKQGGWEKSVKPWPREIDEWTHFLHDSSGNPVARDTVTGPPRHMQWTAAPRWSRNHHTLASISSLVSARGRIFYLVDEGPAANMAVPGKWFLVGRDAFSGVLIWKLPLPSWAWHGHRFRNGPVQLPRTLVAFGERVYCPLGMGAPVSAIDASAGRVVKTYTDTENAEELIVHEGILLVVTGSPGPEQASVDPVRRGKAPFPNHKSVVAVAAESGETLWRHSRPGRAQPVPLTLAAEGSRVFFQRGKGVVCLDLSTGREHWSSSPGGRDETVAKRRAGWSLSTLVVHDGIVLWANVDRLRALSATSGEERWSCPSQEGICAPADVLVIDGLVWLGQRFTVGRDLRTGEVKKKNIELERVHTAGHHHRCYRQKATQRYLITSQRGIEFFDLVSSNHSRNNWIRGVCQYGVMPSNGLIYAPPHACGCYMEAKLYGFWALAGERPVSGAERPRARRERLEKGPAYGQIAPHPPQGAAGSAWPTYRHDVKRSGSTEDAIGKDLEPMWELELGGRLSSLTVSDGKVFVASIDRHTVHALDARGGSELWRYTTGGRVDSPPTIHSGLAIFGSADGWIYCLRAADGSLLWRFGAAPEERYTVALDQIESLWPVHGSVLVLEGVAYAASGRSSHLDGGIRLYGLDPRTGEVLSRTSVRSTHPAAQGGSETSGIEPFDIQQNTVDHKTLQAPDRSDSFSMEGATTDVLVSDGSAIYMRQLRFDRNLVKQERRGRHIFSTSSLLDGTEVHRSHWVLGTGDFSRIPVAYSWIAYRVNRYGWRLRSPYGLMMAFDDRGVWGVRRGQRGYLLFGDENTPFSPGEEPRPDFHKVEGKPPLWEWAKPLPLRPRAMLRAGERLVIGGAPNAIDDRDPHAAFEGRLGGRLLIASTADGALAAELTLDSPPVWDGMAAAEGRLYAALQNGKVICLGTSRRQ